MHLRLIRHATTLLTISGVRLLVDPIFSAAGTMPPIENSPNERRNPLVDLPVNTEELLDTDAVLLTHTHRDHFDAAAVEALPKNRAVICQPPDEAKLQDFGFSEVMPVADELSWRGISITRTGGRHGTGEIGVKMGPVSGYVLKAPGEPVIYFAGDTIWCPEVATALDRYQPDVVVVYAGAAQFLTGGPITMDYPDVVQVCRHAPQARVVVVHMETFNHCLLTRQELSQRLAAEGLAGRVSIPVDGGGYQE